MPDIRPFRALRFEVEAVGDLGRVVAPPYDVIGADLHRALLARHPRNAVRLDLPEGEPREDPDERYRRAARTLSAWRSDGTLRKDPRPSVYVYEQAYRVPGTDHERVQRGLLRPAADRAVRAREPGPAPRAHALGAQGGPLPAPAGDGPQQLAGRRPVPRPGGRGRHDPRVASPPARRSRTSSTTTGSATGCGPSPDDGEGSAASSLVRVAGEGPIWIADGHHRYETAVRYRDERRGGSSEQDPAFDFLLMLFLGADEPLTVLPTHRVVRGLGEEGTAALVQRLPELFSVTPSTPDALVARYEAAGELPGGEGRFGLLTRGRAWLLEARRAGFAALPATGGAAVRELDVTRLGLALEHLAGIDAAAVAAGDRIAYTKSAAEARALVDAGTDGADAAFLLEPTPVASILAVAGEGDVMPQKSTYFYPKALTGLVLNPHEW